MAKSEERPAIQLDDGESNRLEAIWSRSGSRLIVSIVPHGKVGLEWHMVGQVELTPEQVDELRRFLAQRPE
jgi:hypothetical protein